MPLRTSITVIILIVLLIYEKFWRPRVFKKKIHKYIKNLGGKILHIDCISNREEVYNVTYYLNDIRKNATVKFSLFYKQDWYM